MVSDQEWDGVAESHEPLESFRELLASKGFNYQAARLALPVDIEFPSDDERTFMDGIRQRLRVSSFTTRLDSMLMWSHYASQHQGFVVQYDIEELPEHLASVFYPVLYSSQRVTSSRVFDCGDSDDKRLCTCLHVALRKAPDWQYEDEWRLVETSMEQEHLEERMPCPIGIYAGARISTVDEWRLRIIRDELVQEHGRNIPLYRMNLSESDYRMEPQLS